MQTNQLFLKIKENILKSKFSIHKDNFDEITWKLLKRSTKDHDYYMINEVCYILVLSDCKNIIEIIEDDTTGSDYSIDLDSDDDWRSNLDDYESENDSDYSPETE